MQTAMDALLEDKRLKDRQDLAGLKLPQLLALPEGQKLESHRWFFLPSTTRITPITERGYMDIRSLAI